ncbi:MAG: helix-turn-helix transcriptional regulator [Phycisphaerales bacterium]|nr:helix-turn-helix transcriptional regulator [Phycisphaerales bacterium]
MAVLREIDRRGTTIGALARKARVDRAVLGRWLSGKRDPRFSSVLRVLKALQLPLLREDKDVQEEGRGQVRPRSPKAAGPDRSDQRRSRQPPKAR